MPSEMSLNYEVLASELLRAMRGRRSRPGFSRYLGYRSNIAQRWEAGACWPTATRFFAIAARLGAMPRERIAAFLRREPAWLAGADFGSTAGIAALLSELLGRARIGAVAERARYNRFSVARWFKGTADPKLPELLAVIEACSGRALDFVASFAEPSGLPSVAPIWEKLCLSRELAYTHPLSHAVLRALELEEYKRRRSTDAGLARRLGISIGEVRTALELLAQSGQIRRAGQRWVADRITVVDTGADARRARALKLGWARLAIERLESGAPGHSGYSLFAVSREDLRRLREIQLAYVREMQAVIAGSKPSECVGLFCTQLIDLAAGESNVFHSRQSG
jgi:hypothetical protein